MLRLPTLAGTGSVPFAGGAMDTGGSGVTVSLENASTKRTEFHINFQEDQSPKDSYWTIFAGTQPALTQITLSP